MAGLTVLTQESNLDQIFSGAKCLLFKIWVETQYFDSISKGHGCNNYFSQLFFSILHVWITMFLNVQAFISLENNITTENV